MKLQHDSPHHPDPIHPDDFGGVVRAKTSNLIFLARHIYWSYIRISAVQPADCRRVPGAALNALAANFGNLLSPLNEQLAPPICS